MNEGVVPFTIKIYPLKLGNLIIIYYSWYIFDVPNMIYFFIIILAIILREGFL